MRLLKWTPGGELYLTHDLIRDIPPYAILSHTWGGDDDEATFKDLKDGTGKSKAGYAKITFCGEQARLDGFQYFWVDTCCIDKSNSTELAEAINSMFRWYRNAAKCYALLSDVSKTARDAGKTVDQLPWESAFRESRWFTRGWTLQELVAPTSVEFFSKEGTPLGNKKSLERQIHEVTGISIQALQGTPLSHFSIDERMSWRAKRETKRIEDEAYSLLGIFEVSMPLIYGEEGRAFIRLAEEIDKPLRALSLNSMRVPCDTGFSIIVEPENPALDIIFIHGLTGHPQRTWNHERRESYMQHVESYDRGERPSKFRKLDSSESPHQGSEGECKATYWLHDLVPLTAPNARVLTYGYDPYKTPPSTGSDVTKSTMYGIAWSFLTGLEATRRVDPSRPLLFIAHSLGGIVVKEALRRSQESKNYQTHLLSINKSTIGLIFFGTPHEGVDSPEMVENIIHKLTRVEADCIDHRIDGTFLPSTEQLKKLHDTFCRMARERTWKVYSFQEQDGEKALSSRKVVEDTASCLNDPTIEITQHIASNHTNMCRFHSLDDVEYDKVAIAINQIFDTTKSRQFGESSILNGDQHQRLLDCLKYEQMESRHTTIRAAHAKTCKWLLNKEEYQEWLDDTKLSTHHGFLWIKGKPATGKSTLMKFAHSNFKRRKEENIIISFFFNARGDDMEKSTVGMYRSLLYQLLHPRHPDSPHFVDMLAPNVPKESNKWNLETLKNLFGHAVESLGRRRLTCFIDALDECEEDQVREMVAFFARLGQFAVSSQTVFRVCFSSRHYPHITLEEGLRLTLEGQEGHRQDIANYLHSELKAGKSKQVIQIKEEILKRASDIFLWVVLVAQILNKEFDRGRMNALRKRLDEIPNGLEELFQDILTRDGQNVADLVLCLQWILFAKRPLKTEELYFAVLSGAAPEDLQIAAWDPEEITKQDMQRFILSSSKGLAETTKSQHQTVQFIHESVRDFLLIGKGLEKLQPLLGGNFAGQSNERLKHCCQVYAGSHLSEHLPMHTEWWPIASTNEAKDLRQLASEKFPFLEYAVQNVLRHADAASQCKIPQSEFLKLFPLERWIQLNNLLEKHEIRRHTKICSLLYILADRKFPSLIASELDRASQPSHDDFAERYGSPVHVAVFQRNDEVLRTMLSQYTEGKSNDNITRRYQAYGVNPDIISWGVAGRTPLLEAARDGYEFGVRLLIATEMVDLDFRNNHDGRTPLSWAAEKGHDCVVQLILATNKVDVNIPDNLRRTPLFYAAEKGHETVVKLLLATGLVNVDTIDTRSPPGLPFNQSTKKRARY
ncbi:hypothetical protein BU16DRAFT_51347 [Lophium mytilinum]|uniref:Uncharacterized protein n=1 Tax=Lophium mytilinum TaxID=390894 RepID=A0A6A6QRZ4_9PEZI|nr:hypothetical protein BU16DRAFT_51347 [Lophium mytilinum]